jgi:hypothetical protein
VQFAVVELNKTEEGATYATAPACDTSLPELSAVAVTVIPVTEAIRPLASENEIIVGGGEVVCLPRNVCYHNMLSRYRCQHLGRPVPETGSATQKFAVGISLPSSPRDSGAATVSVERDKTVLKVTPGHVGTLLPAGGVKPDGRWVASHGERALSQTCGLYERPWSVHRSVRPKDTTLELMDPK